MTLTQNRPQDEPFRGYTKGNPDGRRSVVARSLAKVRHNLRHPRHKSRQNHLKMSPFLAAAELVWQILFQSLGSLAKGNPPSGKTGARGKTGKADEGIFRA